MARHTLGGGEGEGGLQVVFGVQPVLEMVTRRPRDVERLLVAREARGPVGRVLRLARHAAIPVSHVRREQLVAKVGPRAGHQGIAAIVAAVAYADAEAVCARARARPDGWLVLVDGVTDAGNLGAILRTCAAAGVDGVLLSREGTAGLTPHVVKASAGVVDRIPVAREARPAARIAALSDAGFRTLALDPAGETSWDSVDLRGPLAVVAGGEARGPRPGITRVCDKKVAIPLSHGVESLNVAVATGVLLFEVRRQRRSENSRP